MFISKINKYLFSSALSALVCSSIVIAEPDPERNTQPNKLHPPKATAEEAKIRHWSEPAIDKDFWDIPELPTAYVTTHPLRQKDGIAVANSTTNNKKLMALAKEINDKKHAEVDSLLISHKGKLVFESYFSRGRIDLPHPQSSTTKSYTSLAVGRAIAMGYLTMDDLDKPVTGFLPNLDTSRLAKGIEKVTLNKLLSMSSGISIAEERIEEYRKAPEQYAGIHLVQARLNDSADITASSQIFKYKGADPETAMQVLEAVVPISAAEFIDKELFAKLGIKNYDWKTDSTGLPSASSGSSMTTRNMMKIGTLVANNGKWKGEQLISAEYLEKATSSIVNLTAEQAANFYSGDKLSDGGYGYFWWQTDMTVEGKTYRSRSAQGAGGVAIVIIDELELVIVVNAHAMQAYLQMIAEHIIPAFSSL